MQNGNEGRKRRIPMQNGDEGVQGVTAGFKTDQGEIHRFGANRADSVGTRVIKRKEKSTEGGPE